jgi:glycosyltransferase involved in cell wall biosynthesis
MVITEHTSHFPRGAVRRQRLLDVKSSFRRASLILPVSSFLQKSMQSYGITGRFRVIPNSYDSDLFLPAQAPKGPSGTRAVPRLLTVGLLTEPKGIPVLLRAVHLVKAGGKRFHLDIVGDGSMRADYEQLSAELGLRDEVTFHGMKDKGAVAKFMQQCDFYVQASLWETFGVTVVEALACGKPIVGTQIPAIEEKVSDKAGILVPADDAEAFSAAIESMLESYSSYDTAQIAEYAREHFSHEAVGKALSEVYAEVLQFQ